MEDPKRKLILAEGVAAEAIAAAQPLNNNVKVANVEQNSAPAQTPDRTNTSKRVQSDQATR